MEAIERLLEGGALADLASESILVCDASGRIGFCNPAAEGLFGWPARALKDRSLTDLAVDIELHRSAWSELLECGMWQGILRRHRIGGGTIPVSLRWSVRYDANGHILGVAEFAQRSGTGETTATRSPSVSDMATAAWRLDVSGALALVGEIAEHPGFAGNDVSEDVAFSLLTTVRIVHVNERARRMFSLGDPRDSILGRSIVECWPWSERRMLAALLVSVLQDNISSPPRSHVLRLPGAYQDTRISVWRSPKQRAENIVHLSANQIADAERSASEVRLSEERYRNLIHYMPLALWQVDASRMGVIFSQVRDNGVTDIETYLEQHPEIVELANDIVQVTEVNRKAIEIFGGGTPVQFLRSVRYIFAASPDVAKRVMIAHFTGQRSYREIMKVATFDGRLLDVVFSVTFPTPPERLDITLLSMEDITGRLRTEAQLRDLQNEFAHAARIATLGELASSIAHELQQPLAAIIANAEAGIRWLERDEPMIGRAVETGHKLVSSAVRASETIDRIRRMAVKHTSTSELVDVRDVLGDAILLVLNLSEHHKISLNWSSPAQAMWVLGDRVQLQQVVVNLLINSIQAIEHAQQFRREIIVGLELVQNVVEISVIDTGPGISPGELERIFDGFYSNKPGGMGIGLSICRTITTTHGGTIAASNNRDGGAEFLVRLPTSGSTPCEEASIAVPSLREARGTG